MALSTDTVGAGLVESLARPSGNVAGLTALGPDLSGKRLELIKEVSPRVFHTVVLTNPANPSHPAALKECEAAARPLGVQLQIVEVREARELDSAFLSRIKGLAAGLVLVAGRGV